MKLAPQNARETRRFRTKTQTGKRERRTAPPYTLVWSAEVQALRDITTNEIIELRSKALWRIELAEAARNHDPAVAKLGSTTQRDDAIWSKFNVGKHWFCLDFRPASVREYVVTLAPNDMPPPTGPGDAVDGAAALRERRRSRRKRADGVESTSAFDVTAWITNAWRLVRRRLSRAFNTKVRPNLLRTLVGVQHSYRNVSYNTRMFGAWLREVSRRIASTASLVGTSFTRMRDLSVHWEGQRLEPRLVGQNSGMRVLLYSWIQDAPPVDWNADLFGVPPSDWAANVFGVLQAEERAFT